ncbi:MAG TPA: hypothetical protein VFN37_09150 [Candidatus Baltobacteraceae bacterium]|nr:hypothetical protein [Candidatus Baltobacteraceae bacterium]
MTFSLLMALAAPQMREGLAAPWLAPLRHLVAAAAPPAPSPSPLPSVAPTATPAPQLARGGPLHFSLTGGLTLGRQQQNTSRASGEASSTNQTTENAGLLARMERDTATSRLVFSVPAGLSFRHSTIGLPQIGYYTSKYGLSYGPQALSLLGGVPLGSTLQGLSLILPIHGGDATLYEGPAIATGNQTFRLRGILIRSVVKNTLVEAGLTRATAPGAVPIQALVLGAARTGGLLSQTLEGSIQHQGDSHTFGYQYQANIGGSAFSTTLTLRRIGAGFVDFGGGAVQSERYGDLSVHDTFGLYSASVDESLENSSADGNGQLTRRGQLYVTRSFNNGVSTALTLSDQRQISNLGTQWQGGPGLQASFSFFGADAVVGGQWLRNTSQFADPTASITYTGQLNRQFGHYNASLSYQRNRQTGGAPAVQSQTAFSLGRMFGPTSISLNAQINHVTTAASNARQFAPTISIARQLSPSLSVGVTYGQQFTSDTMNPLSNGRSRIFSVQIAAPFALGNGAVQGRVDPHLPATISGTVVNENVGSQFTFGAAVSNGVANVAVVLDNQTVARTDLSGHFQFNFVTPGVHQVRIESASLPRGVLVDQPYASITVFGGQQANLTFAVGNFGVIEGEVFGVDATGAQIPLDNVTVRLDGVQIAQTDPLGAFGFGRLQPGKHTVELATGSLPANVAFSAADAKKTITVQNGQITKVQFKASPLGSISGKVVFAGALAANYGIGAYNAYVVADPGDYAAIVNEDGSYDMDNMPAGNYSLDIDPETVPPDSGNAGGPVGVVLQPGEHKDGIDFTLTHKQKAVVFTFKSGNGAGLASLTLSDKVLPPLGATQAVVDPSQTAKSVVVHAFGRTQALHFDARSKLWLGMLDVPPKTAAGPATIVAEIEGAQHLTASANLTVDPQAPLATFTLIPAHPRIGENAIVRARFLADVAPGDHIRWLDGQLTQLSRPLTGRVYEFTVKISEQPMRGFLLTKQGELPITLR